MASLAGYSPYYCIIADARAGKERCEYNASCLCMLLSLFLRLVCIYSLV